MDITTMLGSRLAQLGATADIEQIERTQGRRAARRRAAETLIARAAVRSSAIR
ncbi:hypothetical protein [Cumulibacter manganitolerans]|uniref:hypothetical protein n=1 Tax=Cumulibacter manganitolerans TaxID=1884992 RepID=UPI0012960CE2|nr:hypothetical protein [Cumulibacter manganitolerans]